MDEERGGYVEESCCQGCRDTLLVPLVGWVAPGHDWASRLRNEG